MFGTCPFVSRIKKEDLSMNFLKRIFNKHTQSTETSAAPQSKSSNLIPNAETPPRYLRKHIETLADQIYTILYQDDSEDLRAVLADSNIQVTYFNIKKKKYRSSYRFHPSTNELEISINSHTKKKIWIKRSSQN